MIQHPSVQQVLDVKPTESDVLIQTLFSDLDLPTGSPGSGSCCGPPGSGSNGLFVAPAASSGERGSGDGRHAAGRYF